LILIEKNLQGTYLKVNYAREKEQRTEKKKVENEEKAKEEPKVTVVDRPETPIGGVVISGKGSPTTKQARKQKVKEIQHPKVESPKTNETKTETKTNENKANETKTDTKTNETKANETKTDTKSTEAKTNETKTDTKKDTKTVNKSTEVKNDTTTQKANTNQNKKGKGKKGNQNQNPNQKNTNKPSDDSSKSIQTYFEIVVRNTQDKSEIVVGRITSKGPVIDDQSSYDRYVGVL